jgi:predicted RNA binding protein YcfA (HicA-like mRNA interferase family)
VSPALSDLPVRKVTRALETAGFAYVRTKGSHAVYRSSDGRVVVIPEHGTIKRGTPGLDPAAGSPDPRRIPEATGLTAAPCNMPHGSAGPSVPRPGARRGPSFIASKVLPSFLIERDVVFRPGIRRVQRNRIARYELHHLRATWYHQAQIEASSHQGPFRFFFGAGVGRVCAGPFGRRGVGGGLRSGLAEELVFGV